VGGVPSGLDFGAWYQKEHPRLFASLLVLAASPDVAADATDEAFARALTHWERVSEMDSPEGWTYRVAVNVWKRVARRQVVAAPAGEVWDVVRSLTVRQRTAITLRYVADLSEADIATVMGVTRGTVASTLADARRVLAGALVDPCVPEERL
jgi:DNA-directed RNA polymerase specialized sigma24 family protein